MNTCVMCNSLYVKANGELPCWDDAGEDIILGSLGQNGLHQLGSPIFHSPQLEQIRRSFMQGNNPHPICSSCAVRGFGGGHDSIRPAVIHVLHLESSYLCGLSCPQCLPATARHSLKNPPYHMPVAMLKGLLDELRGEGIEIIKVVHFEGRGDPLMNPHMSELLAVTKAAYPNAFTMATTHGSYSYKPWVVESGLNLLRVSIDGAFPHNYAKYRVGGDLSTVLAFLAKVRDERVRLQSNLQVEWKYILFEWNDSDEEMAHAARLAASLDAHLRFVLTHSPGKSKRFEDERALAAILPGVAPDAATDMTYQLKPIEHQAVSVDAVIAEHLDRQTGQPAVRQEWTPELVAVPDAGSFQKIKKNPAGLWALPFHFAAFFVLAAAAAIIYAPAFSGRIPFPASIVFEFPPFADVAPQGIATPHSNIHDLAHSFYPFRALAARAVREGIFPLWNPYMLAGTPFAANSQSALFYPLNSLYYVLPLPVAWTIGFLLRPLLAGLFTALFSRRIGASKTGAMVSAILFAFSGFLIGWQGSAMSDAVIWLPFVCYCVVHLHALPSMKSVILAAMAFAMPVLAGHPETALHVALTGSAFAVFLATVAFLRKERRAIRFLTRFAACGLLAIGISAIQLIPTLEWLNYIHRSFVDSWPPFPPWAILAMVSRDVTSGTNSIGLSLPEQSAYLGMLVFVTVPLAFLHSSRKSVMFFAAASVAAMSVAYGIGPVFWVTQHLPVLRFIKNERLVFLSSFGLAVLAGLGISVLQTLDAHSPPRRRVLAPALAASGFLICFIMIYGTHVRTEKLVEFLRQPRIALALLCMGAIPVVLRLFGRIGTKAFPILVLAAAGVDVCTFAYNVIPFTEPRHVFPKIELFEKLRQDEQPFRIAQIGHAYGANFELMYGLPAVTGYEICLERIKRFVAGLTTDDDPMVMFTSSGILDNRDRRVDLLNAKYYAVSDYDTRHLEFRNDPDRFRFVFSTGHTDIFENRKVLPPAFLVPSSGSEFISDEREELARLRDPAFDPRQSVILSTRPAAPRMPPHVPVASAGTVERVTTGINNVQIQLRANQDSVLVISQIYYPGWKASLDGRETALFEADYALSGIRVPAGDHSVHLTFSPLSIRLGFLVSSLTLVLVVTVLFRRSR